MKAKLYKVLDQYHLYNGDKAIATTIIGNPMLLPNLSKQNCDSIFGVVDVEKLAQDSYQKHSVHDNKLSLDEQIQRSGGFIVGFKEGFNKAMELNKDKLFTLENMATMMLEAVKWANDGGEIDAQKLLDNTIQSLQQPTEIDVEIEMHIVPEGWDNKPRLDSEGCLILKNK